VSKNVAMFVDVANLYYSARGQDVDVDYVALLKTATKGRDLIRAYAYSGLDPENENQRKFIDFLKKNGYMVLTKDIRKFGDGRVKANLDIELVVDLFRLADRMDIAVIVSGDGDFAPAIKALQDKGVRCEVISFRPNTSSDLIAVADEFIDIMKIAGIGRGSKEAKAQRGMSAPEMPAKEVVPEFGFREASPGVAAAALAAIREGRTEPTGRGRGRGRSAAKAAEAEAPAETAAAETLPAESGDEQAPDSEGRRRRRRRGGRGRGRRGRAGSETSTEGLAAGGEDGEVGWVELDDLSQLDELEGLAGAGEGDVEREYTFEEADAATLAELGITPDEATAATDEAEPVEEPKPRRRRTTRKASGEAAPEVAPEAAEPKKPARRRTTKKAAVDAEDGGATDAAPAAEEKPKRSRTRAGASASAGGTARTRKSAASSDDGEKKAPARRRTAKSAAAKDTAAGTDAPSPDAGEGGDESEGIWQRFRSARGRGRTS
jgi:uncharacterized LabA/DUF88 family protein